MATQKITWIVLPNGRDRDGSWRVSIVISPRLTPETAEERTLASFREWQDWPEALAGMQFALHIGNASLRLEPRLVDPRLQPDSGLWTRLFPPYLTVSGFKFTDLTQSNLHSWSLRPVLQAIRKHYMALALEAGNGEHPRLLPWRAADPALKEMLAELGTPQADRVRGERWRRFDRYYHRSERGAGPSDHEVAMCHAVFSSATCMRARFMGPTTLGAPPADAQYPVRALPPDWEDPSALRVAAAAASPAEKSNLEQRADVMERFAGPLEYALWQADRFYRRRDPTDAELAMARPGGVDVSPSPTIEPWDFHTRLASYGDHPNLQRKLGLVLDCVIVDRAPFEQALVASAPATGVMRLEISEPGRRHRTVGDVFPHTAWLATRERFVTRERSAVDHAQGMLNLRGATDTYRPSHSAFDVAQIDPDGTALKTVDYLLTTQGLIDASNEPGADGKVTYTTGDDQPVTALRSGGLGVSRHGRAIDVAAHAAVNAERNAQLNAATPGESPMLLCAEDVLRGYRVDVFDAASPRWRSLVARHGSYVEIPTDADAPARPIELPDDEGFVTGASTSAHPEHPEDLYLHETLFRWTGWSLAAPRPGRTVRSRTEPGSQIQVEEIVEDQGSADPNLGNGVAITMQPAPGTLPRLRFGHTYRLRARLADLAGNGLGLEDIRRDDFTDATEPVTYGRFEPVEPPALLLSARISEGESLERVVLRSDRDAGTAEYTARIHGDLAGYYANGDFEYTAAPTRQLVPPKSSQQNCELHGMFDDAIGSGDPARVKQAWLVATREAGSLLDPGPEAGVELVTPARIGQVATVSDGPLAAPEAGDPARDRFAAGQYLVYRNGLPTIPYLADPACGGVALAGVPGIEQLVAGRPLQWLAPGLPGLVIAPGLRAARNLKAGAWLLLVDFDRTVASPDPAREWPDDMRALRLRVAEQPGEGANPPCGDAAASPQAPRWDPATGELTLFLPKGCVARLRYSSFVHEKFVGHFGLCNWHSGTNAQDLRAEALAGANSMLTPWRELVLVHATQRPACPPWLEYVSVSRAPGSTAADILARRVHLHGPSTGKFEILAEWQEWIDDPAADDPDHPGPVRRSFSAVLPEIRLPENHPNVFVLQEAVRAQRAFEPLGGNETATDIAARPAVPGNRHEFGDARWRFVRYRLRATTRFSEYLPPTLFAEAERVTHIGPAVELDHVEIRAHPGVNVGADPGAPVLRADTGPAGLIVPASAPPLAPEIAYLVPTFRWQRSEAAPATAESTRLGNGIRVYLERPWFSSGDGELLGVVLKGDGEPFNAIDDATATRVSQWGADPLWDTPAKHTAARARDFPARVADAAVMLHDPANPDVVNPAHIVGHRVDFDAARGLWYCDIELDAGAAYMPFVRLALARYQPNAIPGAEISTVILTDFVQLLPRRAARLAREGTRCTLTLRGPIPAHGPIDNARTRPEREPAFPGAAPGKPLAVPEHESRNRVELVFQTRDATLDSDLAWEDADVLAEGRLEDSGSGPKSPTRPADPPRLPPGQPQPPGPVIRRAPLDVRVRLRAGRTLRFDRAEATSVHAPTAAALERTNPRVDTWLTLDPLIWEVTVAVPAAPAGRVGRLMLREFERYYTDRTVPVMAPGAASRQRVIEERLVYAEIFAC